METGIDPTLTRLVEAALPHVAFDGWSPETFRAAIRESGLDPALAHAVAPGGAVDLALAYHRIGDARLPGLLAEADMAGLRYSEKVALAVRLRIEAAGDREAVRRGMTLFSLPQNAALGARALWGTADAIWRALGDTSDDINWYSKRTILSGVYGSTVLYWLGDDSPGQRETWDFLDRRIENVMGFEKAKAQARKMPVLREAISLGERVLGGVFRAPAGSGPQ